ncbi:MAG TPA: hypothetical protein VNY74_08345 [Edaphobacter sp.]|nr:hypothetical protein [Edaphobacter sp.]
MPLLWTVRRLHLGFSAFTLSLVFPSALACAQAIATGSASEVVGGRSASATTNDAGPSGIIPFAQGFNASLGASSQYDSGNGWSSILTPGLAFRFNRLLSVNASVPIYASVNVESNTGTKAKPVYTSTTQHGVPGDTSLAAHLDAHPVLLDYNATFSIGLPSGNTAYGLGAGKTTYDFNNHFEKSFGIFSPDMEFGIGTSNNLIQPRVHKSYTSVGALAHFQAGTSIDLPLNLSLEADLYEELPFNPSTIYAAARSGKKKATAATTGNAEDNGFNTSLDIPLGGRITFSGFYNRSIRNDDDITGFSLTFLLKPPPKPADTVH